MIYSAKAKKIRIISAVITTALILAIFGANIYQCCSYREEVAAKIAEENEEIETANKEIRKKNAENEAKRIEANNDSLKARNGKLCGHIAYIFKDQLKMVKDYECEHSCRKEFRGYDRKRCMDICFKREEVDVTKRVDTCIYVNSIDEAYRIEREIRETNYFYEGKYVPRYLDINIPKVPDSILHIYDTLEYVPSLDFYVSYFLQPEEQGETKYREILNRFFFLDYGKFYGLKMVCAILFAHICLMLFIVYKESLYVLLNNKFASEANKSEILECELHNKYFGPVFSVPYISAFLYCASLSFIIFLHASLLSLTVVIPLYLLAFRIIKNYVSKST